MTNRTQHYTVYIGVVWRKATQQGINIFDVYSNERVHQGFARVISDA